MAEVFRCPVCGCATYEEPLMSTQDVNDLDEIGESEEKKDDDERENRDHSIVTQGRKRKRSGGAGDLTE